MTARSARKGFKNLSKPIRNDPPRSERVDQHKLAMREALALAGLREIRHTTQQTLAGRLDVSQANISRVEHQDDVFLSTLRSYVAALGGRLEISAVFPDERVRLEIADS